MTDFFFKYVVLHLKEIHALSNRKSINNSFEIEWCSMGKPPKNKNLTLRSSKLVSVIYIGDTTDQQSV